MFMDEPAKKEKKYIIQLRTSDMDFKTESCTFIDTVSFQNQKYEQNSSYICE